jgi:hypothetical protein
MTAEGPISARVAIHLEEHLGRPTVLLALGATHEWRPLALVRYRDQPVPSSSTLATLGLSETLLTLGPGVLGRQEFAISAYDASIDPRLEELTQLLGALARGSEASQRGWVPGTVLPFTGPVLDGLGFETMYSADMSYLDADTRLVSGTDPLTSIAWLVPIYQSEAAVVSNLGYRSLEQLFIELPDIDLLDFMRQPVAQS